MATYSFYIPSCEEFWFILFQPGMHEALIIVLGWLSNMPSTLCYLYH